MSRERTTHFPTQTRSTTKQTASGWYRWRLFDYYNCQIEEGLERTWVMARDAAKKAGSRWRKKLADARKNFKANLKPGQEWDLSYTTNVDEWA